MKTHICPMFKQLLLLSIIKLVSIVLVFHKHNSLLLGPILLLLGKGLHGRFMRCTLYVKQKDVYPSFLKPASAHWQVNVKCIKDNAAVGV